MASAVPTLRAHGADIPAIGFGTGSLGAHCGEVVAAALETGYRHIDTARKYGSEPGVAEGLRARMKLLKYEPIDRGGFQMTWESTIEREGGTKPVCVAESMARYYP